MEFSNAYEHQISSEGTEAAVPFAIEYGIRDNLEVLLEPVAYTAILPRTGLHAGGIGNLEATLTFELRAEGTRALALALAEEAKIPAAKDALIGTREPDFATYLIASKRFGAVETHANLACTFVGRPGGAPLNNTASFALAAVLRPEARLQCFAEVLGTTESAQETAANNESSKVPETGGAERSGTLGASAAVRPDLHLHLSLTYDSNAILSRPGLTMRFR